MVNRYASHKVCQGPIFYSWGRVGGTNTAHARAVGAAGYVGAMRYLCYPGDVLEAAGLLKQDG